MGLNETDKTTRVIVTRPVMGICWMGVCAVADATDDEILAVANRENPSGTRNGWTVVIREASQGHADQQPIVCGDDPGRVHYVLVC